MFYLTAYSSFSIVLLNTEERKLNGSGTESEEKEIPAKRRELRRVKCQGERRRVLEKRRGLRLNLDLIRKGGLTLVGRGNSVDVWTQPWIPWLDYGDFMDLLNHVKPSDLETTIHIFWDCPCARALWFNNPFPICFGEGSGNSVKGRLERILSTLPRDLTDRFLSYTGCLFEGIWKARNEYLFKGGLVNIEVVRSSILRRYSEYLVFVNAEVEIGHSVPSDVPRRLTGQKGYKSFASASHAKVLIKALNERKCPPMWTLKPLAMEVLNLCKMFNDCKFYFISRKDNVDCDALARWARGNSHCNGYINREGSPIVIPNYLLQ
ncbi:hypothetical protein G4B88_020419 [Cannabis sativa]|uniref:Uncharacterized protein n=1 Tax=Cannabis sativa TaxID=3483 RepID=A0A7J6EAB4_CANSA|nr:hypothetical protein G4B88_020419 [Cannabis sativa]